MSFAVFFTALAVGPHGTDSLSGLRRVLSPVPATVSSGVDRCPVCADTELMNQDRKKQIESYHREVASIKAAFRAEDDALIKAGRGGEVVADRLRLLGITKGSRLRLKEVNGVRL